MWLVQGNPWVMKIIKKSEGDKEMLFENNDIYLIISSQVKSCYA